MKTTLRFAFLLMLLGGLSFAQATLQGKVVDANSAAIPSVTVTLTQNGHEVARAQSAADGSFSFMAVPAGNYTLSTTGDNFFNTPHQVELGNRQQLTVTLELARREVVSQSVQVNAITDEIDPGKTSSGTLVTHSDLEDMPAPLKRDVPTLAQNMMAGAVASHDNFIHVRGNEMSLHEFINGVAFLDNTHQHFSPGVDPQIFETANLIVGGFDPEFGNRFGGILDVTTRSGSTMGGHGSFRLGAGSLMNYDSSFDYGGKAGKWGYYIFSGGEASDRFLNTPTFEPLRDFGSNGNYAFQLDRTSTKDTFRLLTLGGLDYFQLPNDEDQQQADRNASRRLKSQTAILQWQHTFSERAVENTSIYERTITDHVYPTSDPDTELLLATRSTATIGIKSDWSYSRWGHLFKAGADLSSLHLQEAVDYDPRDPLSDIGSFGFRSNHAGGLASFYAQDRFSPLRNLTLSVGLRGDRYDVLTPYGEFSPRVAVAYMVPRTQTVIHFAYNRFFTPPPLEYQLLSSFIGRTNPDPDLQVGNVKPYRQNYFEAGVDQQLRPKLHMQVTGYYHQGSGSFENSELGRSRIFLPTNYSRARSYGADVSFELRHLQSFGLHGRLWYAYAHTYFFGPFSGGFADEFLAPGHKDLPAFDENHTGNLQLMWQRTRWSNFFIGTTMRYGNGTPFGGGLFRLPQHFTADFSTGVDVFRRESRRVSLEFDLNNATDNRYKIAKESDATPIQFAQQRSAFGRVRIEF